MNSVNADHMKRNLSSRIVQLPARFRRLGAFTLIELLVVVAIIAILAGMLLAVAGPMKQKALVKRVQGELAQLSTAIDRYKLDNGYYPPDHSFVQGSAEKDLYFSKLSPAGVNSLYYELSGVSIDDAQRNYTTVEGTRVPKAGLEATFRVGGVLNSSKGGGAPTGKNYLQDFKPTQLSRYQNIYKVVASDTEGPLQRADGTAFCYVSSAPKHNATTFDLWIDVYVGGKTNRISNWSEDPEIVYYVP